MGNYFVENIMILMKRHLRVNCVGRIAFLSAMSGVVSVDQLALTRRWFLLERPGDIGSLAVFRERLISAEKNLLTAGNHTDCEAIET
jgi:hypothetical protein